MKTLIRRVVVAVISASALVAGATAVLFIAPDEMRRGWLTAAGSYFLRRDISVNGEFELHLGSGIELRATDIRVANVDWGRHPFLLRVGEADVHLSLAELLEGALVLALDLSEPILLLETGQGGVGNWEFAGAAEDSSWELPLSLSPREVTIDDGQMVFFQSDRETPDRADVNWLHWASDGNGVFLELDGTYNELPLEFSSEGSRSGQVPDQVSIDGRIGRLSIVACGTLTESDIPGNPLLDLAVEFASPSLRIVDGQLGDLLPDLGPLEGQTRLVGPLLAPALSDLQLTLKSDDGRVALSGSIDDLLELSGCQLEVNVRTGDLPGLLAAFSLRSPFTLPPRFEMEAVLSGDWPALALRGIQGSGGDGAASARLTGEIGDLFEFDEVDLRLAVSAPELPGLAPYQHFDVVELPKIGPVTGSTRITANNGVWSLLDTRLEAGNGDERVSYQSQIGNLLETSDWDAELRARLPSLHLLGYGLPAGLRALGATELSGTLRDSAADRGNLMFRVRADTPGLSVTTSGRLRDLMEQDRTSFDLELAGNSLADAASAVELDLPDVGPFHFKGRLGINGERIDIVDFQARAGASDLAGQIGFSAPAGGDRTLEAKLRAGTLDLTELLPRREKVELRVLHDQDVVATPKDEPVTRRKRLFSPEPLPFEGLRGARADVEFEADRIVTWQMVLDDVKTELQLADDILSVPRFTVNPSGELVELRLRLDASTPSAVFEFSVHGEDIAIEHVRSLVTQRGIQGGAATLHVDLRGEGASQAEIMANLTGTFGLTIADSLVADESDDKPGDPVLSALNPSTDEADPSALVCAAVYFDIAQGRARTSRGLGIQFEDVTWVGHGEIDLANELIRISMKPLIRKGTGIDIRQVAHLMVLGGTLAEPQLQIDPKGVAGMYARYLGAYLSAGLSLLIEWVQNLEKANEPVCARIMPSKRDQEAVPEAKPAPTSSDSFLPEFFDED